MLSAAKYVHLGNALLVAIFWLGVSDSAIAIADVTESDGEPSNSLSFFVGNTQNGSSNGASLGLEYERRLSPLIGLGAFAEYAGGDFDTLAVGVPVFFHPHAGWGLLVAPGLNFDDDQTNFLVRVGVGYEFEIAPKWSLAPKFNVDLVDGETELVYGLVFSRKF